MNSDDVVMTMNVTQFETSLSKVLSGFMKMDSAVKTSDASQKKSVSGMSSWMIAKGNMIASAITGIMKGAVGLVNRHIPEIGRAFEISREIIGRNLLWPLRKELLPLLQGLLNWVRDHRIMFVQMGSIIVGVFRTLKTIVGGFIDIVKDIWHRLASGIEAIFGKTTQSVTEIINLVLFKISSMAIFIMELVGPIFSWVADQLVILSGLVTDFVRGVVSSVGDLSTNLEDIINIFKDLADVIGLSNEGAHVLGKTFKVLGEIVGMTVKPLLSAVAEVLSGVVTAIDTMVTTVKWAYAKLKGDDAGAKNAMDEADRRFRKRMEQSRMRWNDVAQNTVTGAKVIVATVQSSEVTATEKAQSSVAQRSSAKVSAPTRSVVTPTPRNVSGSTTNVNNNTTQNISVNVTGSQDPQATAKAVVDRMKAEKERTMTPR